MNDLRHDQEVEDQRTHYNLRAVKRVEELRTVPMPDLRSSEARTLDAKARDLCPDCRTFEQRIDADLAVLREAIERIADSVTVLMLERELQRLEGRGRQ